MRYGWNTRLRYEERATVTPPISYTWTLRREVTADRALLQGKAIVVYRLRIMSYTFPQHYAS